MHCDGVVTMSGLMPLTASQQEIVNCQDSSILVLGCPGSGKTHTLTGRIARVIEKSAERHFKVLGLTSANKVAMEMQRRVERMVPDAGRRMNLTTFHAFSASLLRQHGSHVGIRPDFTILTQQAERMAVLKEATEMTDGSSHAAIRVPLSLVNNLLNQNVEPRYAATFLARRHIKDALHIEAVYANYRRLMVKNNELDFAGLVVEASRLLRTVPALRNMINTIYPHICVDEFQDTNAAQYQILRQIVDPSTTNLFVVADDDQIIYQWNGADPKWLVSLREDFGCRVFELPASYRCPPEIVQIANRLIANNASHNADKATLSSHKPHSIHGAVSVKVLESGEAESDWIANHIGQQPLQMRSGCAVLGRNRAVLKPIVEALKSRGVPCHLPMRRDEFVSWPMVWLHAMLRLANLRQGRTHLDSACRSFFALEGVWLDVDDIIYDSLAGDGNHLRAWLRVALQQQLSDQTRLFLKKAVPRLADRLDFRPFVKMSLDWFTQLPAEASDGGYEDEKTVWHEIVSYADDKIGYEQVTLAILLQEIDLQSKTISAPPESIPCYTVPASKGLEFDHVYLAGLVEGEMPDRRAMLRGDNSAQMQEERRICFVAITRSGQRLTLTCARHMFGQRKIPSRFLTEMGLEGGETLSKNAK